MPCFEGWKLIISTRNLISIMTLDEAIKAVDRQMRRMKEIYQKPVFDEWAIVAVFGGKAKALHYAGSRREEFLELFSQDAQAFGNDLRRPVHNLGDLISRGTVRGRGSTLIWWWGKACSCSATTRGRA